jgi:hypothetical protein
LFVSTSNVVLGGGNIWFGAFLMPPIPTVLVHSFLFLLAYAIALIQKPQTYVHILKSSWSGNMEEAQLALFSPLN